MNNKIKNALEKTANKLIKMDTNVFNNELEKYNDGVVCNLIKNTDYEPLIHNRAIYDREADPTLYHCQHKIADINNYLYCPECGSKITK